MVRVVLRCIAITSQKKDVVLDPFVGAGTTAIAAQRLHRQCIGLELNPEYADLARARLAGQPAPSTSEKTNGTHKQKAHAQYTFFDFSAEPA